MTFLLLHSETWFFTQLPAAWPRCLQIMGSSVPAIQILLVQHLAIVNIDFQSFQHSTNQELLFLRDFCWLFFFSFSLFSPLKQTFGRERLSTEILCLGAKSSSQRGVARRLASLCQKNSLLFSSSQPPASLWQPKAGKSNIIPTPKHLFFPLLCRLQLHKTHPSLQALLWSRSLPSVSSHNWPPICRSGSKHSF